MPDSGAPLDTAATLARRLEELDRIAKLTEPVLRNLQITQKYCELSRALAGVLGEANANWSTFATWASKTAGSSIREQDVPPELSAFLRREAALEARLRHFYEALGPLARFAPKLDPFDLARAIIGEVSRQIAEGNLRVYAELAPLFAKFAATFTDPSTRSESRLNAFLAELAPGPAEKGGQDLLGKAFRSYFAASLSSDDAAKTELILFGNLMIGLHEQTRLQDNICGALDAPFSEEIYLRFGAAGPKFLHGALRRLVKVGVRRFAGQLLDDWQRLATRLLMKLSAPNGDEIPLGRDLPPERFDPLLRQLKNSELIAFMLRFDSDISTTRGCAAVNWTLLSERMKFIGELFRVSQRDRSWFDEPFTALQRDEMTAGRVPPGPL
jgi:hypothetical protein